jgi:hypothetical protein
MNRNVGLSNNRSRDSFFAQNVFCLNPLVNDTTLMSKNKPSRQESNADNLSPGYQTVERLDILPPPSAPNQPK